MDFEPSSLTISELSGAVATPTGRPQTSPLSVRPGWRRPGGKPPPGGCVNKTARAEPPGDSSSQKLRRARFHAALHLPDDIDERVQFVVELAHLLRMQLHRSLLIG